MSEIQTKSRMPDENVLQEPGVAGAILYFRVPCQCGHMMLTTTFPLARPSSKYASASFA